MATSNEHIFQTPRQHVSPTHIRTLFSESLSSLYKSEVALYSELVDVVNAVNRTILERDPDLKQELKRKNDLNRLNLERHGAIRLGSAQELRQMASFLRILGMVSVGYYDLAQAGLPIHATCFRTIDPMALGENPLRLFVSLLRLEDVSASLRPVVEGVLSKRRIFSQRVVELMTVAEKQGGLTLAEATELVVEGIQTFRWRGHATVSKATYDALLNENPILADIVGFQGPHINHLTPRALDIDLVQASMHKAGLPAKQSIEGPPRREVPILLRQTSYYAQREEIVFSSAKDILASTGFHTARFGEIEERGAALSPKGRALYDTLLESATIQGISAANEEAYARHFQDFPDDWTTLRREGLVWGRYVVCPQNAHYCTWQSALSLEELIDRGVVRCEPIVYEDFLPISAAGIFQSNLRESGKEGNSTRPTRFVENERNARLDFEEALGGEVLSEMDLYRNIQEESIADVKRQLAHMVPSRL